METIKRTVDVIQGRPTEQIGKVHLFPIYMGCTKQDTSDDIYCELSWQICPDNGIIQLKKLIPLEVLYSNMQHSGSVGKTWMEHHEAFAEFIAKLAPRNVLEIGGAHGILSKIYRNKHSTSNWCIVEPDPKPVNGVTANFIKAFFNSQIQIPFKVDTVIHSHVLEHIYEPSVFLEDIKALLQEGGRLIFSVPNMEAMLLNKYTNCINFEHTIYLTEPYIDYLLAKHGFQVESKSYFKDDHSIFYACVQSNEVSSSNALGPELYERNKKTYLEYESYYLDLVSKLNRSIAELGDTQRVYLFGAHIFSQHLISLGLNTERIDAILDNDENKQHNRLYGTSLRVISPKSIAHEREPIVILKAGSYCEEIKEDILSNINPSTIFME